MGNELTRLYKFVSNHYSLDEFQTLCFELDVRYDDLRGEGISAKARALVITLGEEQGLDRLIGQLKLERLAPFSSLGLNEDVAVLYAELDQFIISTATDDPFLKRVINIFSGGSKAQRELSNRKSLLQRVSNYWIKGYFEESLYDDVLIDLGMEVKPGAVENPWEMILQRPEQPEHILPPGTTILDMFNESGDSLLILGEPGSGKTTMLLELTRQLITRTQSFFTQPLPVVFNLSSWAEERLSLDEWLEEELLSKYDIPQKIARPWIENDVLLLLLDGLDEVGSRHREGCVQAINAFHQEHLVPLVVCSRIADYEILSTHLRIQSSVQLRPLSPSQITAYLQQLGFEQSSLYSEINQNDQLQTLAQSPMMLNIMALTLQDGSLDSVPPSIEGEVSIEAYRKHLFALYVQQMFEHRRPVSRFTVDQTTRWLSWLAQTMKRHDQTTLLVENMQSTWLPTRQQRILYQFIVRIVGSFMFVFIAALGPLLAYLLISITLGSEENLGSEEILVFMRIALITSLVTGINYFLNTVLVKRVWGIFVIALFIGAVLAWVKPYPLRGSIPSLLFGLLFGIPAGLAGLKLARQHIIKFSGSTCWSWPRMLLGAVAGMVIGLLLAVIIADDILIDTFVVGIPMALWLGLILGQISEEIPQDEPESAKRVRQPILHSFVNASRIGGIVALAILITPAIIGIFVTEQLLIVGGLVFALLLAGPIALAVGLASDGTAVLQHSILRVFLFSRGLIPWALTNFLDYTVDRVFLRKVGSGYVFIHQWLLAHFAAINSDFQRSH